MVQKIVSNDKKKKKHLPMIQKLSLVIKKKQLLMIQKTVTSDTKDSIDDKNI